MIIFFIIINNNLTEQIFRYSLIWLLQENRRHVYIVLNYGILEIVTPPSE